MRLESWTTVGRCCAALASRSASLGGAGPSRRRRGARSRATRPEDRLGSGPGDAQPVRRPGRGGLHDLGDQLGPAGQLQPQGPLPGPGHRRELGRLRRQEDGHLPPRSRREVVRRQADHLRGRQVLARGARRQRRAVHQLHRERHQIETPDADTVVIHTKRPDARIVGGLFIYILPKHVWGKVPVKDLTGSLQARAAAGRQRPVHRHRLRARAILTMEHEPGLPRAGAEVRRDPVHPLRQPGRRRARAPARRGRHGPRGLSRRLRAPRRGAEHRDAARPRSPAYTRARVQHAARRRSARTPSSTPRSRTRRCARRSPTRSTASASTRSPPGTPRSPATASCPRSTSRSTRCRTQDYPYDPEKANQILDDAGWQRQRRRGRGPRTARSSRSTSTCARSRRPTSRRRSWSPSRPRRSGSTSTSRWSAPTSSRPHGPEGRRQAGARLRHVHLGLGRRSLRPELPAQPLYHRRDRRLSDSFYSNPDYDRLYEEQAGEFDIAERKEIIQRMVAITQRDLPYIVLTYDPNLQAYRTDRIANVEPVCPEDSTGDVDLRPDLLRAAADDRARGSSSGESGGGGSGIAIAVGRRGRGRGRRRSS